MWKWAVGALLLAILVVGLSACNSGPPATDARIAYEVEFDAFNFEIFVIDADGTNRMRLTTNRAADVDPAWSPDRRQIAYASNKDGNFGIYVMQADGTRERMLTSNTGEVDDFAPNWSPDGDQIVYISWHDENWELYLMDVGRQGLGTNLTRLTQNAADDIDPDWSPDGSQLLFTSMRDGNWELYLMETSCFAAPETCGAHTTRLTNDPADDFEPQWSPDGSQIAWFSNRDGNYEIYLMNADGTRPRRLTIYQLADTHPAWSPDGNHIVFHSFRQDNDDLYIMNANGTDPVRITNEERFDTDAAWR